MLFDDVYRYIGQYKKFQIIMSLIVAFQGKFQRMMKYLCVGKSELDVLGLPEAGPNRLLPPGPFEELINWVRFHTEREGKIPVYFSKVVSAN